MRLRILKLAYRLRYHYWGNWPLEGWLIGLLVAAAVGVALARLPQLLAGATPEPWFLPALLLILALSLASLARRAAAAAYLSFAPEPDLAPPAPHSLLPADKVLIHATGCFEVEGKRHFFADLLAYWRTFASREHAVMAIVHPSRFLLLGTMPERDRGMWYIFFCADKVLRLAPGQLADGGRQRPALQVVHQPPRPSSSPSSRRGRGPRLRPLPPPETVYLIFDDDATRRQVWADLLADAPAAG